MSTTFVIVNLVSAVFNAAVSFVVVKIVSFKCVRVSVLVLLVSTPSLQQAAVAPLQAVGTNHWFACVSLQDAREGRSNGRTATARTGSGGRTRSMARALIPGPVGLYVDANGGMALPASQRPIRV